MAAFLLISGSRQRHEERNAGWNSVFHDGQSLGLLSYDMNKGMQVGRAEGVAALCVRTRVKDTDKGMQVGTSRTGARLAAVGQLKIQIKECRLEETAENPGAQVDSDVIRHEQRNAGWKRYRFGASSQGSEKGMEI